MELHYRPANPSVIQLFFNRPLALQAGAQRPEIPVYVLTKTGEALASITPHDAQANAERLYDAALDVVVGGEVRLYTGGGTDGVLTAKKSALGKGITPE